MTDAQRISGRNRVPERNIVLVVDDEQTVVRTATTALAMGGFRAVVAENGLAGLECFMNSSDEICLVLADIVMPFMKGTEMAERIQALRPDVKILLMTGYSDSVIQSSGAGKFPLIRKPFLPEDLMRAIRALLSQTGDPAP